jgi:hypothetical protein
MTATDIEPVACVADIGAAAYHLKVFSFVEECVLARESAGVELEAG